MRNRRGLKFIFLPLVLLLAACTPAALHLGGPAVTPSPVFTPTPSVRYAAEIADTVKTVCLDMKINFETNGAGPDFQNDEELVARTLKRLGIQVVEPGGACDAALTVQATLKPLSATYDSDEGQRTCFTGAQLTGTFEFAAAGYEPTSASLDTTMEPVDGMIFNCSSESSAPYELTWVPGVLRGFSTVWGSRAVVEAMQDDGTHHPAGCNPETIKYGVERLDQMNETGAAVPKLAAMALNEDLTYCRSNILYALSKAAKASGDPADQETAVQALIEAMRFEREETGICDSLESLTGVDASEKNLKCTAEYMDQWKAWWSSEKK